MSGDGGSRSPDVLLSFAKDGRYIADVEKLLSDFAVSLASVFWGGGNSAEGTARRGGSSAATANDRYEDDGQRFADSIRPELNFIASLVVHTAPLIYYTRRFSDDTPPPPSRFRSGAQRSIGMEALNLRYHFPNDRASVGNVSAFSRIRDGAVQALQLGTNRWQRLLLLQTIFPYVMNRVRRGGWSKDLGSMLRSLSRFIGTREHTRSLPDESRRSGHRNEGDAILADDVLNDDRLRGSARRRLFHEQRRRMASSVDSAGSDAQSSSIDNDNRSIEVTESEGTQFQRLRLSRLCWKWANVSSNLFMFSSIRFYGKLPTLLDKRVSQAISSLCHGAHTLANHGLPNSESLDRWSKMLKWLLRLHLALFYWNGVYPSLSHRLVGAKIKQDLSPYQGRSVVHQSAEIVANRPSLKPIAVMILVQAASAMIRASCELSVEVIHNLQLLHLKWKRRQELSHLLMNSDLTGRHEYMNLVEQCVPSIDSFNAIEARGKPKKKSRKKTDSVHQCGICLSEHVNPAVPTNCGHVFCWNCIQHWVSNVKNECPLCRAKAKPQDILPLRNYFT